MKFCMIDMHETQRNTNSWINEIKLLEKVFEGHLNNRCQRVPRIYILIGL